LIYDSLIKSHFQYGIPVWGGKILTGLEITQKRAIRAIVNNNRKVHTNTMFNELGILKISDLYKLASLIEFKRMDLNLYPKTVHTINIFRRKRGIGMRSHENKDVEVPMEQLKWRASSAHSRASSSVGPIGLDRR
jgi:hypothetical protein